MNEIPQQDEQPLVPPVPLPGRGARLRAAREALGLSQEDMAARLRLAVRQVHALETDDETALPPPPFVRGFVRNYARSLGLDPAEFDLPAPEVPAAPASQPPAAAARPLQRPIPLESGRASANRRWLFAALAALVLAAIGSWIRMEHINAAGELIVRQAQPSLRQLSELVGGGHTEPAAVPPAGSDAQAYVPAAAERERSAEPPRAEPAQVAAVQPAPAAPSAPPSLPPGAVTASLSGGQAGAANRKLSLDFDADCWIEVRDDNNQVVLSGVSRAGEHRDLEAHGPLRIVVGNAPATRLSWNGRPVDLAEFTRVTVARLTLDPAVDHP